MQGNEFSGSGVGPGVPLPRRWHWIALALGLIGCWLLGAGCCLAQAQQPVTAHGRSASLDRPSPKDEIAKPIPAPLHGLTVDDTRDIRTQPYLSQVTNSLSHLSVRLSGWPTVRLTYTLEEDASTLEQAKVAEPAKGAKASTYLAATQTIAQKAYILGEVVDSSAMHCLSVADHNARWRDYVATLGEDVDIWEVGNEINGNWLDNSRLKASQGRTCPWREPKTSEADVVAKMVDAYRIVKQAGKAAAITLYYDPNPACNRNLPAAYQTIRWAKKNIPADMKAGMDDVFVSYYPDNCPHFHPDWTRVFAALQTIFPHAQLGVGEWGYSQRRPSNTALKALLREGYRLHPRIKQWAGGVFYWEFGLDAVPYDDDPNSIWSAINTDLQHQR